MRAPTVATLERRAAEAAARGDFAAAEQYADQADQLAAQQVASLAGSARWYASMGVPVFPLQPGSKRPWPGSHGVKDATTDVAQINAWWRTQPQANIGLAAGVVFDVIDLDGPEAVRQWLNVKPVPQIGKVKSPRTAGWHLYVPVTGATNKAGALPKIDVRGSGGYVVAPPSILDSRDGQTAGRYVWLQPPTFTAQAAA